MAELYLFPVMSIKWDMLYKHTVINNVSSLSFIVKDTQTFKIFLKICTFIYMCVGSVVYVQVSLGVYGGQKKKSDLLELKLEDVVNFLMWVLVTELRGYRRAASALNR